jgi:hypothetical protein
MPAKYPDDTFLVQIPRCELTKSLSTQAIHFSVRVPRWEPTKSLSTQFTLFWSTTNSTFLSHRIVYKFTHLYHSLHTSTNSFCSCCVRFLFSVGKQQCRAAARVSQVVSCSSPVHRARQAAASCSALTWPFRALADHARPCCGFCCRPLRVALTKTSTHICLCI